jgi:long-subunit acyl-CoA synthetase (AMP-forming)
MCNLLQACNRMSYVCVPLYETLGEDAIEYILEHSEARMVVVAGKRLGRMAAALKQVDKLAGVVYWGEAAPADLRVSRSAACGAKHACRTGIATLGQQHVRHGANSSSGWNGCCGRTLAAVATCISNTSCKPST